MDNVRIELERLLQNAENVGGDAEAQRVWASQVKRLIDVLLGPGPHNIHSEAFWDFDFAASHAEKAGILRSILLSTPNTTKQEIRPASPPHSVFLVHGREDSFLTEVEEYLNELGVDTVVLKRIGGASQSLFQKFMQWGKETRFALVLLTSDDLGASYSQYKSEGVAEKALQFRARQNVILELGFFYGHLGWENV